MPVKKVNSNGPPPGCPDNMLPEPAGMEEAVRMAEEDASVRAAQRAKRQGMCGNYTKAPWLVK